MDKTGFRNEVEPFYFGIPPKILYGCHHKPRGMHPKRCGVVLCSPIGQEYIDSHRAVFQLAVRLSQADFHVLRFDYFGCGDSGGSFQEGSFLQWTNDIHTAIAEMQKRSGLTSVCVIGLRIGATLALEVADNCLRTESVVLWEPIFDGRLYLKELSDAQRKFFGQMRYNTTGVIEQFETGMPKEVLGFPMTSELRHDLEMIKMDHLRLRPNMNLLIIFNSKESNYTHRPHAFERGQLKADFQIIEDHIGWKQEGMVPFKTIRYLVNWLNRVHS